MITGYNTPDGLLRHLDEQEKKKKEATDEYNNTWHPVTEDIPPCYTDDETSWHSDYLLLSFANFSLPMVGRYEEDEIGNGAFYLGDETETCVSQDLFVNAWRPLPACYRG